MYKKIKLKKLLKFPIEFSCKFCMCPKGSNIQNICHHKSKAMWCRGLEICINDDHYRYYKHTKFHQTPAELVSHGMTHNYFKLAKRKHFSARLNKICSKFCQKRFQEFPKTFTYYAAQVFHYAPRLAAFLTKLEQ